MFVLFLLEKQVEKISFSGGNQVFTLSPHPFSSLQIFGENTLKFLFKESFNYYLEIPI
jgi:hypothetical protein